MLQTMYRQTIVYNRRGTQLSTGQASMTRGPDMDQSISRGSRHPAIPLPPCSWKQLEDLREVRAVLEDIRNRPRTNIYECAELYDLAYPGYEGDCAYYLQQGSRGHVLYLGVGTGRIFAPLASQNSQAIGVELSPTMVQWLQQKHPYLRTGTLIEGDVTKIDLPQSHFDTVLAPYSFLQVIAAEKLAALLKSIRTWLKPGGRFCTDTFSPYSIPFRIPGLETNTRGNGAELQIVTYIVYDHLQQAMTELTRVQTPERDELLEMNLRYYFPQELVEAMHAAGFESVTIAGGYQGETFDPLTNDVLVYEANARE